MSLINKLLLIGFILLALYAVTSRIVNNRTNKCKKENNNLDNEKK